MIDFLMILSSLILHEGGAKTGYSSSGEEGDIIAQNLIIATVFGIAA